MAHGTRTIYNPENCVGVEPRTVKFGADAGKEYKQAAIHHPDGREKGNKAGVLTLNKSLAPVFRSMVQPDGKNTDPARAAALVNAIIAACEQAAEMNGGTKSASGSKAPDFIWTPGKR